MKVQIRFNNAIEYYQTIWPGVSRGALSLIPITPEIQKYLDAMTTYLKGVFKVEYPCVSFCLQPSDISLTFIDFIYCNECPSRIWYKEVTLF